MVQRVPQTHAIQVGPKTQMPHCGFIFIPGEFRDRSIFTAPEKNCCVRTLSCVGPSMPISSRSSVSIIVGCSIDYPLHQHRLYHILERPYPLPPLQPLTLLFQPVRLQAHGVAPPRTSFYSAIPERFANLLTQSTISCSGGPRRVSDHTLTLLV